MENITIGQIISVLTCLSVLAGFFIAIFKFYKSNFADKFTKLDKRVTALEKRMDQQEAEMGESKEERLILLKSQLACLKGLHNDLNCNGPVTQGIADLEEYLIKKSHQ